MWQRLKSRWQEFRNDKPGERFRNSYARQGKGGRTVVSKILALVVGGALMIAGFLLGLIPGVPGIVLGVLGLGLIATRFRGMALWLDWAEVKVRRAWQAVRRRRTRPPAP